MENAGRGATDVLERRLLGGSARGKRVVVVCGTGNNGGDGFVIARHLSIRGAEVTCVLVGQASALTDDARKNHEAWVGIGGDVTGSLDAIMTADAIVDALFGTGLSREIAGDALLAVGNIASSRAPVLAVDIPSGIDADTGRTLGAAVVASATATFAHFKKGLLTPNGASHAGVVEVVDIGVPGSLSERTGADASLVEDTDVRSWLTPRAPDAHKYRAGHVGVLAGSPGKTGAALLVARGALRGGAGAVTVATWSEAADHLESRFPEVMTSRLDVSDIDASVESLLHGKRAIVAGPGFGTNGHALRAVQGVVSAFVGTVVLDADALTLFAGHAKNLASSRAKLVLTPHSGEAARLLGVTAEEVEADRYAAARSLASSARAVVLLKGAHTLVAEPQGRVVVCPVACPALATAGSGDVLAGIVGALAGSLAPFEAAAAGALVHARSGEAWARQHGDRGLLAGEIADGVPGVLASLGA